MFVDDQSLEFARRERGGRSADDTIAALDPITEAAGLTLDQILLSTREGWQGMPDAYLTECLRTNIQVLSEAVADYCRCLRKNCDLHRAEDIETRWEAIKSDVDGVVRHNPSCEAILGCAQLINLFNSELASSLGDFTATLSEDVLLLSEHYDPNS